MGEAISYILLVCDSAGTEPFIRVGEKEVWIMGDGGQDFLLEGKEVWE